AAHSAGDLDRVLVAVLGLLTLASFEAVTPLPLAARELTATIAAGRRVLELTEREPAVRDPAGSSPSVPARPALALEGVGAAYTPLGPAVLADFSLPLPPGTTIALAGPSGAGHPTLG